MLILKSTALILAIASASFFYFLQQSSQQSPPGITSDQLHSCPTSPNCISSEKNTPTEQFLPPISIRGISINKLIDDSILHLTRMGGTLEQRSSHYVAITFSSDFFGFIDDVELRVDEKDQLLHFRSAARLGKTDFGVNNKRMQEFKQRLLQQL